jgi:2-phosphoglycerate kinase
MDDPTIILIGGAAGTAKTSCGKLLSNELDINHRLGSGFIREIAKSFIPVEENAYLYNYSFKPHNDINPFENLYKQSQPINESMEMCIQRAYNEGTSLLIEGVNVIPGLINTDFVSAALILTVQDYDSHYAMVTGHTHAKRDISDSDFKNIRDIQEQFIERAKNHNWHNIEIGQTVDIGNVVKQIIKGQ